MQEVNDTFELYRHPEIYDIAFSWELSDEIRFFKRVFESHPGETYSGASLWNGTNAESPGWRRFQGHGV